MDSEELAKGARELNNNLPAVFATGGVQVASAADLGNCKVLSKPFPDTDLLAAIETVVPKKTALLRCNFLCLASAGGMFPMGPSRCRLLNQSPQPRGGPFPDPACCAGMTGAELIGSSQHLPCVNPVSTNGSFGGSSHRPNIPSCGFRQFALCYNGSFIP